MSQARIGSSSARHAGGVGLEVDGVFGHVRSTITDPMSLTLFAVATLYGEAGGSSVRKDRRGSINYISERKEGEEASNTTLSTQLEYGKMGFLTEMMGIRSKDTTSMLASLIEVWNLDGANDRR